MACCITELRDKDVINIGDGRRLGFVCDVEIDACTGRLTAIILPGRGKGLAFFKSEPQRIPWDRIVKIGGDAILVELRHEPARDNCR